MKTNTEIKALAENAAKLSGVSLEVLREKVRTIRKFVAQGEDLNETILHFCGEDGEDHMDAQRRLMYAVFNTSGI